MSCSSAVTVAGKGKSKEILFIMHCKLSSKRKSLLSSSSKLHQTLWSLMQVSLCKSCDLQGKEKEHNEIEQGG